MTEAAWPDRTRVLGVSPFGAPDPRVVAAVTQGGGLGVLDLGGPAGNPAEALRRTSADLGTSFGVRVPHGCPLRPADVLPDYEIALVVLGYRSPWTPASIAAAAGPGNRPRVLAEVTGLEEAEQALAAGADGVVARGQEAGGRVGELTSFVLLQHLAARLTAPIWVCGGIGPHTAAAVAAGGGAGVVLDTQLSLFPDTDVPRRVREHFVRMDSADAQLATLFAARFATARQAVQAIARTPAEPPEGTGPAEQGAALCRSLGIDLPIAQGPMTRVSDQPGFAAAVAGQGAMPYVAVALATGAQTRELLRRTGELLGDRPWGAGILGFVSERLRAEQLAAIRDAGPRSVLIAGGTPAQAKALEAEGIATYLHVPSPILLGQFLAAGVRRFVFEGAECGGHIGPRSSFSLWEAQLDALRSFVDEQRADPGIEVFFAGGIHDARSSAMVAALSAPLARRGVSTGILMGTAYLFTEEAVRHGAITGTFQRQALIARRTATLETAPGHQTRCLPTPFVEEFAATKARLEAQDLPARERWELLEALNTGRLRIASKGLRRDGDALLAVDDAGQLADGMYLAGQVAVLRDQVTDIAALHHAVIEDAAALLRAGERRPARARRETDAVAVVGMACAFPGAPDLPAFWSNVLRGVDAVTEVPAERWDPAVYHGEHGTPSKWGGFLPRIPFDPTEFGIPPSSLGSIDPAQLLSLRVAAQALADAGYRDRAFDRERTSVIFGAEQGGDLANAGIVRSLLPAYLDEIPAELDEQLPRFTEDSFPGTLANVISGRIANRLDLGGANYTVDAACGSSLAALDLACKELRQGSSDLVLCGAVDLHNGIHDYLMFASAGALSPTGRCRPFDRAADGIALGEGVACLALKRLADAERDGDRIYAVVSGVGAASDGKALGLTAPRPEGQYRALARAYADAGLSPAEVGLVEAHGTGTVVGDATELTTLSRFFTDAGAWDGACALGSVKSQIGHTKCAAGLAGLIKAALSVWHGVIPPTLHLTEPNPAWDPETSPFSFTTEARPWPATRSRRIAGVSAFGFGGTNFHAVLAQSPSAPAERHGLRDWDAELFLFRGRNAERSMRELRELAERGDRPLRDLAAHAGERADREADPVRFAVVARDRDELVGALTAALAGEPAASWFGGDGTTGKLAFLFPGQGSQRTGMLAELFVAFPELRRHLDADAATAALAYPPHAFAEAEGEARRRALRDTRVAQPALGMVETAVCELLDRLEVRPGLLAGHSYGELVALSAAGAFDTATLLRLSRRRAEAIAAAAGGEPGAMAAVNGTRDDVAAFLERGGLDVVIANHNAPNQIVLSGRSAEVDRAVESLRARAFPAKRLPVACAFHSPVVAAASAEFAADLAAEDVRAPRRPVWANRTARAYPADADVRAELAGQLAAPVRFADQIEDMYAAGARVFLEVGPGKVLTGLVGTILGNRPHTAVATDSGTGLRGLLTALARLAVSGVDIRTEWLFRGRAGGDAEPAKRPPWTVDGQLVRRTDGGRTPNGLVPAQRIPRMTMTENTGTRDDVVVEFLRTNREIIAAQRDVLLGYFGQATAPVTPPAPPAPAAIAEAEPVAAEPKPEPKPAEAVDVLRSVIEVISDRTGYPADLIEGDLDLEADLSIDSIKRAEIAGTLIAELGLTGLADDGQDELSRRRTANSVAEWLTERLGPVGEPTVRTEPVAVPGLAPQRFVSRAVAEDLPGGDPLRLRGKEVVLAFEPGQADLAAAVRAGLAGHGASVRTGPITGPDVLVCLGPLAGGDEPVAPRVFGLLREAARAGVDSVLVACTRGEHAAGLRGLVRAAVREGLTTTLVELDVDAGTEVAGTVVAELLVADPPPVVAYRGGERTVFRLAAEELGALAHGGAGPAGPGAAEAQAIGLDRDSVVLLVGGARGITARFATTLATAAGCRIELAGRTPWPPEPEDPDTRELTDRQALRRVLAARTGSLADVDRQVSAILAQREVARTLAEIRAAGSEVAYRGLDVRDGVALRQTVKDLYAQHGRLDGIVYAAGVIDDRLLTDKGDDSFRTVFSTKVDGARALLESLPQLGIQPGFVTFFGSIAAVLGNRGQSDYAAANDALESLGAAWAERTGIRVLTVHWGPWAPAAEHGGMVSPELARDYRRREIGLIDPDAGTAALLRELAYGPREARAVVYTASPW
ncbi:type I polyketide synthase [Amycolatopsis anabasis]|uniref:type I polyketide synthase n=1 Tax=Amycolatopsis anabasis TaxID=1840409 RepID=UPI001FEA450A|nr:type I polyketide synthase [Amycolatopsis anabasis]